MVKQLETFFSVVEYGSIHKAAESLFLTQPAVTLRIRQLEEITGTVLFERLPGGVRLTPAGQAFYTESQKAYHTLINAIERAKRINVNEQDYVNIGINRSVGVMPNRLFKLCRLYKELYPNTRFTLHSSERKTVTYNLVNGNFELVGGCFTKQMQKSGLKFCVLQRYPLCAYVPNDSYLAGRGTLDIADLRGREVAVNVISRFSEAEGFLAYLKENEPEIHLRNDIKYDYLLNSRCQVEDVILLAPEGRSKHAYPLVPVPFEYNLSFPIGFIYYNEQSPVVKEFIELARKQRLHSAVAIA